MSTQTAPLEKVADIMIKIEKSLFELKKSRWFGFSKAPVSLKGILKNAKIADSDIKQAKKSLFKHKI